MPNTLTRAPKTAWTHRWRFNVTATTDDRRYHESAGDTSDSMSKWDLYDTSPTSVGGSVITGMVSGANTDIDTSAEELDGGTEGYDVACKRVDLQAGYQNTDDIWVGDSGVLALGGGGGIRLQPGDFYSMDVNNLTDIWVIGISANQAIYFNYFT